MLHSLILLKDFQASQVEFWLPTEHQGYDVSSFGRVRSWWKRLFLGKGSLSYLAGPPKILKQSLSTKGYFRAGSAKHNHPLMVHQLVANTFLPNPYNHRDINHRTGLRTDNRVGNLEHVSHEANMHHAYQHGLIDNKGERNGSAKLDVGKVKAIRCSTGKPETIAAQFGVSPATVRDVLSGRYWRHVI